MEVFNKLYSSVSNTVSQLSGVLPGNPVTREFEATQYIASAGPGELYIFNFNFNVKTLVINECLISVFRFIMESLQRLQKINETRSIHFCVRKETTGKMVESRQGHYVRYFKTWYCSIDET